MKNRWTLILGILALCAWGWYYSLQQDNSDLQQLVKKPDSPDYVGNVMNTKVFSPEGKAQYVALSDKVSHYADEGRTDFEMPLVYLYDTGTSKDNINDKKAQETTALLSGQSWKLSAKKARLTKNEMLYLEGDVVAESLEPASRLQRIETQTAVINLKTQDINSDEMVKINGQNFHSTGLKMVGNLRQQVATLKEQVKTYYEVTQQ